MQTSTTARSKIPILKGYKIIYRTDTQPSEVIGAEKVRDKLMLHIKWKNGKESLVYAEEANARCPQLVIAFYQKYLLCIPRPA